MTHFYYTKPNKMRLIQIIIFALLLLIAIAVNAQITVSNTAELTAAMQTAQSGQTVILRGGTYRMTVTPTNSGVTFRNYEGEVAIISGLNQVASSWTVHSGQIYKTSITLPVNGFSNSLTSNTTILANQIFKNSVMQLQARWPKINSVEDMIDRWKLRHYTLTQGIGRYSTTDNGMPAGNFTGASIFVTGWFISETRTITGHAGKTISYSGLNESPKFQKWYYITNDLELLTQAKEWHYENGTLYFWQEGGGPPTNVEYKARNWGFDLRGKDNTQIIGIHFIGCEPATGDGSTDGTVIDNIRASYQNHAFVTGTNGDYNYYNAKQTGIKLLGNNNTIKNSEFKYVSSQVIWASNGTVVENNLCAVIGWEGNYGAFVGPWGTSGGNIKILRNDAYNLGRSAVDFGHGSHPNIEIGYNHFYNFSMLTCDVGATYGCCGVQIPGTRIHHNWIHDNMVRDGWRTDGWYDGIHVNIYFDQGAGPATVDHNVLWNGSVADGYSEIKNGVLTKWYNNTFGTDGSLREREVYFCPVSSPSDVFRNNIFRFPVNIAWSYPTNNQNSSQPGDVDYSIFQNTDPKFVGPIKTGLGYKLESTSPAVNTGIAISGITDGSIGVPDVGAFEYGAPDWIPGYKATTITPPIPPDTLDPEPPQPPVVILKDTVFNVTLLPGYRTKGVNIVHSAIVTKVEAETGVLVKAGIGGANGYKVCCMLAGATMTYKSKISKGKIKIRYSRANAGTGQLKFRIGSQEVTLDFPATGGWDAMQEKEFTVPAGSGDIVFTAPTQGPCDIDWFTLE